MAVTFIELSGVLWPRPPLRGVTVAAVTKVNRHYVCLTNGVEMMEPMRTKLHVPYESWRFTRIQSSLCEAQAYEKILSNLDHDLCFNLSMGHACYVYDLASRNRTRAVPRSIWMGLAFAKFALTKFVLGDEALPPALLIRGKSVLSHWHHVCDYTVKKPIRRRLKYYREFAASAGTSSIDLFGVYGGPASHDGDKEKYASLACQEQAVSGEQTKIDWDYATTNELGLLLAPAGYKIYKPGCEG